MKPSTLDFLKTLGFQFTLLMIFAISLIQWLHPQFWNDWIQVLGLFSAILILATLSSLYSEKKFQKYRQRLATFIEKLDPQIFVFQTLPKPKNKDEIGQLITKLTQTQNIIQDQTNAIKKQLTKASHLRNKDPITGLNNRNLLMEMLEKVIYRTQRGKYCSAFLFININQFTQVNDQHDHMVGDALLQKVARRLENKIRKTDFCFRFSGDEFIIIYDRLGDYTYQAIEQSEKLAEFLLKELSKPYEINDLSLSPTFSIGIKVFNDQSEEKPITILQHADIALNQAKKTGRNQAKVFDKAMLLEINQSSLLESALEQALENNEISWVIQPQINMQTLEVIGGEVLMRWHHQGHAISPVDFIPLAEESGQIVPMTYWMLKSVFIYIKQHQTLFENKTLAINLSPVMFNEPDLITQLQSLFSKYEIDPRQIKFEITESIFLDNIDKVADVMKQIKSLGSQISLDDFGTGFSSLNYLKSLPIDQLKIDKSFLNQLLSDPKAAAIIKTIIDLTENLQIQVIAEGIEYPEQADFLQDLNCVTCQGYLYSKPLDKDDFVSFTEQSFH